MRILVAHPGQSFSVADVYAGWVEALRGLGQHVVEYNLDARLTFFDHAFLPVDDTTFRKALVPDQVAELAVDGIHSALYKVRPDILLVISGFFLPVEVYDRARSYGTRVVIVHTESPYEDTRQLELAPHADLNLLNDPTNIESYLEVSRALYVPHAYRPSVHHPGPARPEMVCDLGFVGTGFPSRIGFLEAMDLDGLDVLLAGNWQLLAEDSPLRKHVAHDIEDCCDNTTTADIYRSARAGLNIYRREAQAAHLAAGQSMGPREVEMAACGLFFLRDPRPESDEVLGMLPTFAGPEDASEQLRWWIEHDAQRQELANRAREAVADRTFTDNAAALLRLFQP